MSAGPERTEPAAPVPPATPPEPPSASTPDPHLSPEPPRAPASSAHPSPEPPPPAPSPPPNPVTTSMAAFGGNESCPNCGARMAVDQRYCLNCGHRRGDPRLPFMDAVTFMESMNAPGGAAGNVPPPPPAEPTSNRMNANAALIAGVATLVLAIGVGFLIGRSGHDEGGSAGAGKVQVVQVGGGAPAAAGGEEAAATPTESPSGGKEKTGSKAKGAKPAGKTTTKEKSKVKEGSQEEEELAKEETAKVLHSKEQLLEPKTQVGESCEEGAAGCTNGKFEGNFFE